MTKKAKAEGEGRRVYAARLDERGVYQGMDHLPESELTPLHLPQIRGCDLPPGEYRWDADAQTFVPAPRLKKKGLTASAERAFALGFLALHTSGAALPPETLEWLKRYFKTVDEMGNFDAGVR